MNELKLAYTLPVQARNAGYFISRGKGEHPDRVIDTFELMFVTKGRLSISEGNQEFCISENETLILWPHRRHKATRPFEANLRFYWLHFSLLEKSCCDDFNVHQHTRISRPDHLTNLFRRFLDDQEGDSLSQLSANLLLMLMLTEVTDSRHAKLPADESASMLASRVNAIIRTSYHQKLSTSLIASTLHRNPDYLGRVFKRTYGMSITDAIHQYRLKQARKLLLENQLKVAQVAQACGYSDTGYFTRLFRRSEGIPPKRFKRLHAKVHVNTG